MISIECFAETVVKGSRYRGHIKVNDTVLNYEVLFSQPITIEGFIKFNKEPAELLLITMKRNGIKIDLNREEQEFFCMPIFCLAAVLYACQIGQLAPTLQVVREYFPVDRLTIEELSKITTEGLYDAEGEVFDILSAKKFDCQLA